jgi:hypothetical protein
LRRLLDSCSNKRRNTYERASETSVNAAATKLSTASVVAIPNRDKGTAE